MLVAVTDPVSLSPHGISEGQAAQDYYPISQVEKLRLKETRELPRLMQLVRAKVRIPA